MITAKLNNKLYNIYTENDGVSMGYAAQIEDDLSEVDVPMSYVIMDWYRDNNVEWAVIDSNGGIHEIPMAFIDINTPNRDINDEFEKLHDVFNEDHILVAVHNGMLLVFLYFEEETYLYQYMRAMHSDYQNETLNTFLAYVEDNMLVRINLEHFNPIVLYQRIAWAQDRYAPYDETEAEDQGYIHTKTVLNLLSDMGAYRMDIGIQPRQSIFS